MQIGRYPIGHGSPCLVTAEIGQAHDGSLGTAHAYIDAVAKAKCNAVKFQVHIAEAESTTQEPFRVSLSGQDKTRHDYWRRMEFTIDQWKGLRDHALASNLEFLATPFSEDAIDLLTELDVPAWKVGSGDVTTLPMLEKMAKTGKMILLSSGMSTWNEMDEAVATIRGYHAPLGLYQCSTHYPCNPEDVGLNVMLQIRDRYKCPVGLSDHSGTIYAGLAAKTLGADLLEVHVVFSRECFGPDVKASLTTLELADLVKGVRFIEGMKTVDKDLVAHGFGELRQALQKNGPGTCAKD
jgi:N-acetylneuraminate synthase